MLVDKQTGIAFLLKRWHEATPVQKRQGKIWYLSAHDYALSLAWKNGFSLRTSSGIIAALSPRNVWADNKKDAEYILGCAANDCRGAIRQDRLHSHHPNLENVFRILDGVDPDKTLGQKSKSFYRCIYNPMTDEVCVDSWAAKAVNYTDRWIKKEDYPVLQSYYRCAAKEVGTLSPIMQATVWIQIRKKHD